MTRLDLARLDDITDAIVTIRSHASRGPLSDGLVMDAVRIRLLEIGEAVKGLSPTLTALEPDIPWRQIARMRDQLAHHYFATLPEVIQNTVEHDLEPLENAVARMRPAATEAPEDAQ